MIEKACRYQKKIADLHRNFLAVDLELVTRRSGVEVIIAIKGLAAN